MGSSDSDSDERRRHKKQRKKEKKSKKPKKEKKHKKKKYHKKRDRRSSGSSSNSESDRSFGGRDEWVEKVLPVAESKQLEQQPKVEREDWMNSMLIPTYSKEVKTKEDKKPTEQYDPKTSVRELNPHWRDGGSGLPSFRRPVDDDEDDDYGGRQAFARESAPGRDSGRSGGWRKHQESRDVAPRKAEVDVVKPAETPSGNDGMFLTDQQLNDLGAKIIKAEIMGNNELAASLKDKLEKAKAYRAQVKDKDKQEQGNAPKRKDDREEPEVRFTANKRENVSHNKKQRKIDHLLPGGNLADKFRSERFENDNMDAQFFKTSAKLDREANNLENIFDHGKASSSTSGQSNEEKIARDMNKQARVQADCERCLNSSKFSPDFVISMGKNVFLAVPSWKALQPKHCLIVPVGHYAALTLMDEDVFQDLLDTCKALKRMFADHRQEVIFFETVRYINRSPHAYVQCVPADNYEMAPFYFKKAILESETEWAMNKKLHNMQGLEIRRTVPKGLPYFWVNFNLESGFAHVIEDQEEFPVTFASETIAGILGLDTRDWRKPGRENNPKQRVKEFLEWWKEFDCLTRTKE
ncbi:CWF19-like protein 2 [Culex pipiens pallens]|uniref:CWF19-like protein 2 n=1 Tax=Culex pipiens pallens TaxID=42434 RepID=UPI0019531C38|nr:CWF19-like protein 2 [Culex pipiens pallens]